MIGVNPVQFLPGDSKTLTAFAAEGFILFLSILGIVEMALELAAMPLRAAVADIGRLQNPEAMLLHIVRTMLAAGDIA